MFTRSDGGESHLTHARHFRAQCLKESNWKLQFYKKIQQDLPEFQVYDKLKIICAFQLVISSHLYMCLCTCLGVCVGTCLCMCVCAHLQLWRPEEEAGCRGLSIPAFSLETGFLTAHGTRLTTSKPQQIFLSPATITLGFRHMQSHLAFYVGACGPNSSPHASATILTC